MRAILFINSFFILISKKLQSILPWTFINWNTKISDFRFTKINSIFTDYIELKEKKIQKLIAKFNVLSNQSSISVCTCHCQLQTIEKEAQMNLPCLGLFCRCCCCSLHSTGWSGLKSVNRIWWLAKFSNGTETSYGIIFRSVRNTNMSDIKR